MTDYNRVIPRSLINEPSYSLRFTLPKTLLSDVYTFAVDKCKMNITDLGNEISWLSFSNGIDFTKLRRTTLGAKDLFFVCEKLESEFKYKEVSIFKKTSKREFVFEENIDECYRAISNRLNENPKYTKNYTAIFAHERGMMLRIERFYMSNFFTVEFEKQIDEAYELGTRSDISNLAFDLIAEVDAKLDFLKNLDVLLTMSNSFPKKEKE